MKKELKDFLHLYLGCEVIGTYHGAAGSKGYLTGITNGGTECEIQFIEEDGINVSEEPEFNDITEVKLILRPLSNMTREEKQNDLNIATIYTRDQAERVKYFLSKNFDIFGLIEAGIAIDKTTLKLNSPTD